MFHLHAGRWMLWERDYRMQLARTVVAPIKVYTVNSDCMQATLVSQDWCGWRNSLRGRGGREETQRHSQRVGGATQSGCVDDNRWRNLEAEWLVSSLRAFELSLEKWHLREQGYMVRLLKHYKHQTMNQFLRVWVILSYWNTRKVLLELYT